MPNYLVCFRSFTGARLQRDTGQSRLGQAIEAGRLVIEKEYLPIAVAVENVSWEDAIERLKARLASSGNRGSTSGYYLKLIRLVRRIEGADAAPLDLTDAMASAWRDKVMVTKNRRGRLPSSHYISGLICGLSALWQRWLIDELKIVGTNPWKGIEPPKADKLAVKYASDEQITHFYAWIAERFGDWPFPKLFLSTKAYSGCRLMDLCSLEAIQLKKGRLVFPAELTKGRKERAVPLPKDLLKALEAIKGEKWLWEKYVPELKIVLARKGFPIHRLNNEFSPRRLYFWIETLFADYRKAFKDRPVLTSHMFRKRAFTMAWEAGIDARRASIAYGCNVDTLMKHYVLMDEQQVTDDVFKQMDARKPAKRKKEVG